MDRLPRGKNRSPACTICGDIPASRTVLLFVTAKTDFGVRADRGLDFQGDRIREGLLTSAWLPTLGIATGLLRAAVDPQQGSGFSRHIPAADIGH